MSDKPRWKFGRKTIWDLVPASSRCFTTFDNYLDEGDREANQPRHPVSRRARRAVERLSVISSGVGCEVTTTTARYSVGSLCNEGRRPRGPFETAVEAARAVSLILVATVRHANFSRNCTFVRKKRKEKMRTGRRLPGYSGNR